MIAASAQASSDGGSGGVAAGGVAGAGAAELEPAGGGADDWANESAAGASAEESPASPTVFRKRRRAWAPGEAGSGPGDRDMRASLGVPSGPREATLPPPCRQPARPGGGARASDRPRPAW